MNVHKVLHPFRYTLKSIKIEFLVLHYTATSLVDTLKLFQDPKSQAFSHLVIDLDGTVFDLLDCLAGTSLKAWHAGESHWIENGKPYKNFNDCSIGIELVNKNGNLFAYTKEQYQSLKEVLKILKKHHPALRSPKRVVGHEHIAGHRGKVDPGLFFSWPVFFKTSYPNQLAPMRKPVLKEAQRTLFVKKAQAFLTRKVPIGSADWMALNIEMENTARKAPIKGFPSGP